MKNDLRWDVKLRGARNWKPSHHLSKSLCMWELMRKQSSSEKERCLGYQKYRLPNSSKIGIPNAKRHHSIRESKFPRECFSLSNEVRSSPTVTTDLWFQPTRTIKCIFPSFIFPKLISYIFLLMLVFFVISVAWKRWKGFTCLVDEKMRKRDLSFLWEVGFVMTHTQITLVAFALEAHLS